MLERFNRWFTSSGGVWQTAVAVIAWTVVATAWRGLDPHLFLTMAVLTIYSGITQPALAYAGAQSADKLDRALAQVEAIEQQILAVESRLAERIDSSSKGTHR